MNTLDELTILSERPEAYVGICKCCSTINFVYKNIAIKFKEDEFNYFKTYFDRLKTEEFIFESRTGKNIFMSSPAHNIVFCFGKDEVAEMKALMQEASALLEIYKILG